MRLYSGGQLALDLDLPARPPQPGVPYPNLVVLPQWRTEQVLRDRLAALGGTVALGRELVGLDQDDDGVTATVVAPAPARSRRSGPPSWSAATAGAAGCGH